MTAGKCDITIEMGATYNNTITYSDSDGTAIDVSAYVPRMQVRNSIESTTTILDLNSTNGYITVSDGPAGEITINVPASITAVLSPGNGVYDIEIDNSVEVIRLLQGNVYISKDVTR